MVWSPVFLLLLITLLPELQHSRCGNHVQELILGPVYVSMEMLYSDNILENRSSKPLDHVPLLSVFMLSNHYLYTIAMVIPTFICHRNAMGPFAYTTWLFCHFKSPSGGTLDGVNVFRSSV